MENQTGIALPELVPPEFEPAIAYVFEWFQELNMARSGNGFGMNLLSYGEVSAWVRLSNRIVSSWEISVLKMLDVLYVNTLSAKKKAK